VEYLVRHVGLDAKLPTGVNPDAVIEAMYQDKKRRGTQLRFVLLHDVGEPYVADDVTDDELAGILRGLSRRAGREPTSHDPPCGPPQ
jgi:3-dehydroquinate synthetase